MPAVLAHALDVEALAVRYHLLPSEVARLSVDDFAYNARHLAVLQLGGIFDQQQAAAPATEEWA